MRLDSHKYIMQPNPNTIHVHPKYARLQLCKQTLALQQQHDLVDGRPDVGLRDINDEISLLRRLIWVIDTSEALDLARASLGVDTTLIRLLSMVERCGNVHEVERSVLLDRLLRSLS